MSNARKADRQEQAILDAKAERKRGLIPLPKYGEMEKTFDPVTRRKLGQ